MLVQGESRKITVHSRESTNATESKPTAEILTQGEKNCSRVRQSQFGIQRGAMRGERTLDVSQRQVGHRRSGR